MEQEIFGAGVRPGSPATTTEIKMLLCFILSSAGRSMSFSQLHDALSEDALVNYFDLVEALEQLEGSGHLCRIPGESGDFYSNTRTGNQAAEEFKNTLPRSVRERAVRAAGRVLERQKRLEELVVEISPDAAGGYQMRLAIPQEGGELISFFLYSPTREQCEEIRRRFLNAPQFIYKGVLALLTGNRAVLVEVFPSGDDLLL